MAVARVPQPSADDTVQTDPRHYKVEFKNDRVRVVRIKYGPGEKSVMHSHPKSVTVFLTDAHAKFTYPDGRSEDIDANAGCCIWLPSAICRRVSAASPSRSSKSS
jgi:quercetin dioxygenase-like cupin family protein